MSFSEQSRPSHDAIARRAYELFLERGGQAGDPSHDWLRAEAELTAGAAAGLEHARRIETAQPAKAPRKARAVRRPAATDAAGPSATSRPRARSGKASTSSRAKRA